MNRLANAFKRLLGRRDIAEEPAPEPRPNVPPDEPEATAEQEPDIADDPRAEALRKEEEKRDKGESDPGRYDPL
jgi:hypothetical protein